MEFLMTYGWAILVVLAAIGALAYFGILSPSKFLPSSFTMSGGLSAGEYKFSPTDELTVGIINNMGTGITIKEVYFTTSASSAINCTGTSTGTVANSTANGVKNVYTLAVTTTCSDGTGFIDADSVGKKVKGTVSVVYSKDGETIDHTATGDLTTTVE